RGDEDWLNPWSRTSASPPSLRVALTGGERFATEVLREATALGLAAIPLRRARKALGVQVRREGFGKDGRFLLALTLNDTDPAGVAKVPKGVSIGDGLDP